MKKGFDYKKYIVEQKIEILKRLNLYDRLYLEFGGKLCYDMHASRVLPGYLPSTKVKLLKELGDLEMAVSTALVVKAPFAMMKENRPAI